MERRAGDKSWLYGMFILLQSILYGIGNPLSKIAFESISALWCLAVRFGLAFAVFALLFGRRAAAQLHAAKPADYLPAGLSMALAYITCNLALERTSATNVGFLMSLPVLFAPLLSSLLLRKPYKWLHLPVQLAVVLGLYLLCANGSAFRLGAGDILALCTALCVAGGLVFGERALKKLDAVVVSTVQLGVTALLSTALAFALDDAARLRLVTPQAWAVVAYLAIGCSCIAYVLQNSALLHLESRLVSLLQCTQPVLTALFAYFLLGEALRPSGLFGAALILACIVAENVIPALREG